MWKSDNIKNAITGGKSQYQSLKDHIREKNLNFIIARGQCMNRSRESLEPGELDTFMDEFARCSASMINWSGTTPSPPFLAAETSTDTRTAKVSFLVDLTREAEDGEASPFYSKIMGALATQFFAALPDMDKLWFPFILKDTVGRGVTLEAGNTGMFIVRN